MVSHILHALYIIITISFHFPMLLSISFIKIIYLCLRKKSWFNNISEETEKTLFVIITSGFLKHLCDVLKSFCKTFNLLKSSVKLKANLCSRVQSQFSHSRVVLDRKLSNPLLNLNYWIFKLIFSNRTQSMFDYFPKHMTYLILSACTHFQISLVQKPWVTPPHLFNQIYDPFAP